MITMDVNGGPMGTLGDKERMEQALHRNLGTLQELCKVETIKTF